MKDFFPEITQINRTVMCIDDDTSSGDLLNIFVD